MLNQRGSSQGKDNGRPAKLAPFKMCLNRLINLILFLGHLFVTHVRARSNRKELEST
jgi:hypothetical protein